MSAADLAQKLISFASVTPDQAGCMDFIHTYLSKLGFECTRLPFDTVDNLYARWGNSLPNLCFAGHVDVVPVPDPEAWTHDPFSDQVHNDHVYGRGTVDMKGAIAAFMSAAQELIQSSTLTGSVSFLLTSDEEGLAINGTRRVVDWLKAKGETISLCLVGEPTSVQNIGDMIKIGRRGSLNAVVSVNGLAGHVAYPENFVNPVKILIEYLSDLTQLELDSGTGYFQASNLEITSVDVGNPTSNVVPAHAHAHLNIRFNDLHTGETLIQWLKNIADKISPRISIAAQISGEAFRCTDMTVGNRLAQVIKNTTGIETTLSTSGGTSDARFIKDIAPVVELGLLNKTAHQINERAQISDIETLTRIYTSFIRQELNCT